MKPVLGPQGLIVATAVFLVVFYNRSFFRMVLSVYPLSLQTAAFLFSLAIVLIGVLVILFTVLSAKWTTKPMLILTVLSASVAAYFMDNYGVVIDKTMVQNIAETNLNEVGDLLSLKFLAYFLVLGVIPSILIYKTRIVYSPYKIAMRSKGLALGISLLAILSLIAGYSAGYASFFREHKALRYYTNPASFIYAVVRYLSDNPSGSSASAPRPIGLGAKILDADPDRELIVLVVGETARADRFSLNGYSKKTNPLLEKEAVISFKNFYSCGTSTAVSVPCLFSHFGRVGFSDERKNTTENVLDVLHRAGVKVLWRDNNSDSKGVALRVAYQDFRHPDRNPICDVECRDIGMLVGLQDYIDRAKEKDVLIVLHQMGNHGPAYFKRYPEAFEVFKPACKSIELQNCSKLEIDNAYDNAILYTDYFLSEVIALLKHNSTRFETALFYVSDHGESLGENNFYLHGLPNLIAPEEQRHVGAILWFGEGYHVDRTKLQAKQDAPFSHDNIFHTLLGFMEIETDVYDPGLDILSGAQSQAPS